MNNKSLSWMKYMLYLFGLLTVALPVQAASFDCAKAGTKVEHIICDNPAISKLDENLAKSYKAALQGKSKAKTVRQAQKQWMKERNKCAGASCVKQSYDARLTALMLINSSGDAETAKQETDSDSRNGQQYHFRLTKGTGTPVCDAYLKRLNVTKYEEPPFCGRPENDDIKGFVKLNRAPLTPAEANNLYPIISNFMLMANQKGINWSDKNLQLQFISKYKGTALTMKDMLNRNSHWAKIWRYDPPVDIDNDGVPENVEVWYGSVLPSGVGGARCGDDLSGRFGRGLLHQPQIAFVVTDNNDRLDVVKTEKVFGHPKGGVRFYDQVEQKWKVSADFRPIGDSIGIFKYQNLYYFDTFFNRLGDFEDKRQKDKSIANTLGVFLDKGDTTKQMCEYVMTDSEHKNEGEIK